MGGKRKKHSKSPNFVQLKTHQRMCSDDENQFQTRLAHVRTRQTPDPISDLRPRLGPQPPSQTPDPTSGTISDPRLPVEAFCSDPRPQSFQNNPSDGFLFL